ncbi:GTP 3',8-cyclase MoaA [Candidatus Bathyarchaeota archaeon]|nr:GTP 3',8-cyclase MoaA [Candidatus Bathyarchaeota archaeon]
MITDRYCRPVENLRISLTQRCDLDCFYCHREGHDQSYLEMEPEEILEIARVGSDFGVRKIKLTGGEPLMRKDLQRIVSLLDTLPGIDEISMVTNARQLSLERALELREAGLDRVNINLPSTDPLVYRRIVGRDVQPALAGVEAASKAGLTPVKLNMVLLRGLNSDQVHSMMSFAKTAGAILQLIELEPLKRGEEFYTRYHHPLEELEQEISSRASKVRIRHSMQNRKVYTLGGLDVEIVKPVQNSEFCLHCTKIRLTSDGKLKPCLMSQENLLDILTPLRRGEDPKALSEIFRKAIELRRPYYSCAGGASLPPGEA